MLFSKVNTYEVGILAVLNIRKNSNSFNVSNEFVDKFMCDANGSFVKVYLYCLRLSNSGDTMSVSKIATLLNMIQSDVISALKYWDNMGILEFSKTESNDYYVNLFDDFNVDKDKYIIKNDEPKIKEQESPKKQLQINTAVYTRSDLNAAIQGNEKIKQIFTLSAQLLNKTLNTNDMNIIYMFYDYLKFPPEVIFSLIEYCVSIGKSNMRYIEKVGLTWADDEINTTAKAAAFIKQKNREMEFDNKYKQMFKVYGRDFTDSEIKMIKSWVNDLKASDEIIMQAYDLTVINTGKLAFKYMDTVVKNLLNSAPAQKKDSIKKNNFQDYASDGYDMEIEFMKRQMPKE